LVYDQNDSFGLRDQVAAMRILLLAIFTACAVCAQPGLTKLLEGQLSRFPAKTGVYVKHLGTGEEAAVRADQQFSSASVIKLAILSKAYQMVDAGELKLDERTTIRREDLRDGTGILQYHDIGQRPTLRDLMTEMVITSDNTATDLMTLKVGGVEKLNAWLASSGYQHIRMVGRGYEYRRKLLALLDPAMANMTPEETTALQYASADNPLFTMFQPLFTGEKAKWVAEVRDPANRRKLAAQRDKLTVEDPSYWLGDMNPRETGRLLEAIERGTIASKESCEAMRTAMRRQQAGTRRLPHFLDVPVAHKTGDSGVIANDVGMIYARSGTIVVAFFSNGITGPYAEAEDRIGRLAQMIVEYFDGARTQ
jgi:beta-lactamase class A